MFCTLMTRVSALCYLRLLLPLPPPTNSNAISRTAKDPKLCAQASVIMGGKFEERNFGDERENGKCVFRFARLLW